MKRCPTCQATFGDEKRFCQIDGTPLLEVVEPAPPVDPFKTIVGTPPPTTSPNISDDVMKTFVVSADDKEDILQIPEVFDPMKTVVASTPLNFEKPSAPSEPVVSAPDPPKFNEPSLSPPNFSELSGNEPTVTDEPPKIDLPSIPIPEAPKSEDPTLLASPFSKPINEPPKVDAPIANPFTPPPTMVEAPKFEANPLPSESPMSDDSPFNKPLNPPIPSPFDSPATPPPTFNQPQLMKVEDPKPVGSSPFDQPATPFGQSNEPFGQPIQNDPTWNPPPAPIQSWQDQSVGQNTPFQPPAAGASGPSSVLAIISLVSGIISLLSLVGSIIPLVGIVCGLVSLATSIGAIITGFLGRSRAKNNPEQYGGAGLALGGIIMGVLTLLGVAAYIILVIVLFSGAIRF